MTIDTRRHKFGNHLTRRIRTPVISSRKKVLVLFTFHKYIQRVKDFINKAIFYDEQVDFLIISSDNKIKLELPSYVKYMTRENIGYDFGAWSDGLMKNNIYKNYDNFIFLNSSVSGPYLPENFKGKWTDIYLNGLRGNVKLFGSSINGRPNPLHRIHVQSYAFCMNKETLEYLIKEEIFSMVNYMKTFKSAINYREIMMSRLIITNGWNIGCLLPEYKGVDFTFKTKRPEEYKINLSIDFMNQQFKDKNWTKNDLVFVKGNRIDCKVDCKI